MDTDSLDGTDSLDRTPSPYSDDDESKPLWVETPLVRSPHIPARLGFNVHLKMEVIQRCPSRLKDPTKVKPAL
jgi:hypothetical protein